MTQTSATDTNGSQSIADPPPRPDAFFWPIAIAAGAIALQMPGLILGAIQLVLIILGYPVVELPHELLPVWAKLTLSVAIAAALVVNGILMRWRGWRTPLLIALAATIAWSLLKYAEFSLFRIQGQWWLYVGALAATGIALPTFLAVMLCLPSVRRRLIEYIFTRTSTSPDSQVLAWPIGLGAAAMAMGLNSLPPLLISLGRIVLADSSPGAWSWDILTVLWIGPIVATAVLLAGGYCLLRYHRLVILILYPAAALGTTVVMTWGEQQRNPSFPTFGLWDRLITPALFLIAMLLPPAFRQLRQWRRLPGSPGFWRLTEKSE